MIRERRREREKREREKERERERMSKKQTKTGVANNTIFEFLIMMPHIASRLACPTVLPVH